MKKLIALFLLSAIICFVGCDKKSDSVSSDTETTTETTTISETEEAVSEFEYSVRSGEVIITKYTGNSSSVVIPEEIEGMPVVSIARWALEDSGIEDLTLPETMTELPVLKGTDEIKKITLPSGVSDVTDFLRGFRNLEEVDIHNSDTYKSVDGVLYSSDGKTLVIFPLGRKGSFSVPDGVEIIGQRSFSESVLSEITLSDSIKKIDEFAFSHSAITHITIPSSVEVIEGRAFYESSLETVTLNEGLKEIKTNAFKTKTLKEIYIPDSVEKCLSFVYDETKVSASFPTEGFSSIKFDRNITFRDETTLQRAVRLSEKKITNGYRYGSDGVGRIFVDLSDDNFPELIIAGELYYFDFEKDGWEWVDSFYWVYDYHNPFDMEEYDFYICYDKETNTKRYYSPVIRYENEYADWGIYVSGCCQGCLIAKDNKIEFEVYYDDDVKEISELDVTGTLNISSLLENYNIDDYQNYELIVSRFSDEPNEKPDETESMLWGDNKEISSFPYFSSNYPDDVQLEIDGKDILRGEKVEGVTYEKGVLILDNVNIEVDNANYAIAYSGMDELAIKLIGENRINAEISKPVFKKGSKEMYVVFEGDGSLETYRLGAENIKIIENAKITETFSGEGHYFYSVYYLSTSLNVSGNGEFIGDYIQYDNISLSGNGQIKIRKVEYIENLMLSGDSYMEVIMDENYTNSYSGGTAIDCVEIIRIDDNAKLYVENKGCTSVSCYPNGAKVIVSGKGVLEIKGNPENIALSLDNSTFGTLTINDEGTVKITDAKVCVFAPDITINGGTLDCHASENGTAIFIDTAVSPYANFVPGLYINGEIISQSCDNFGMTSVSNYIDAIASEGKTLKDFSVTVKQKEKEE